MSPELFQSLQSEALLSAPMALVCLGGDGHIVWLNTSAEALGLSPGGYLDDCLPELSEPIIDRVRFEPASTIYRVLLPHSEKRCRMTWREKDGHFLIWLEDLTAQLVLAASRREESQPYQRKLRLLNQLATTASGYSELLEVVLEDDQLMTDKVGVLRQYQTEVSKNLTAMLDAIRGEETATERKGTVLVADSHQDLATLIAELLRTEGYRTESFTDGGSVLRYLKVNGEGVTRAVIDEELTADQESLIHAIQAVRPGLQVIALTVDQNAASDTRIAKPVDFNVLLQAVQRGS